MKSVAEIVKEAEAFGQHVCREKGLQVLEGELPTSYQLGISAVHAREDVAACFYMLTNVLMRQQTIQRWLYGVVFLLVCVLSNLR